MTEKVFINKLIKLNIDAKGFSINALVSEVLSRSTADIREFFDLIQYLNLICNESALRVLISQDYFSDVLPKTTPTKTTPSKTTSSKKKKLVKDVKLKLKTSYYLKENEAIDIIKSALLPYLNKPSSKEDNWIDGNE